MGPGPLALQAWAWWGLDPWPYKPGPDGTWTLGPTSLGLVGPGPLVLQAWAWWGLGPWPYKLGPGGA